MCEFNANSFIQITRNYVTSNEPLDKVLTDRPVDVVRASAGHSKHEWTSWAAETAVFEFIENLYQQRIKDEL